MTVTESRELVGERFELNPDTLRSIRLNVEYTNKFQIPADLAWKPLGNIASKKDRYKNMPQGRPLWQELGGQRGDLVNVSLADLVVGFANNGLVPMKAYNEERTGRPRGKNGSVPKYRTTWVYMFPEEIERHPNRDQILVEKATLDEIRGRSVSKYRELRRDNMWGHTYVYLNPAYDNDADGNPVPLKGKYTLDVTAIYKTPLVDRNGKPMLANNDTIRYYTDEMFEALNTLGIKEGQPISPLYALEVLDRKVSLFRNRVPTRAESYELAKELSWTADADAFAL